MRYDENWNGLCENPLCSNRLEVDHVTLVTTAHVRRFCSVECIALSQQAHYDRLSGQQANPSPPPSMGFHQFEGKWDKLEGAFYCKTCGVVKDEHGPFEGPNAVAG